MAAADSAKIGGIFVDTPGKPRKIPRMENNDYKFTPVWNYHGDERCPYGQNIGTMNAVKVSSEYLGITIIVHRHRSQIKNTKLATDLLEIARVEVDYYKAEAGKQAKEYHERFPDGV